MSSELLRVSSTSKSDPLDRLCTERLHADLKVSEFSSPLSTRRSFQHSDIGYLYVEVQLEPTPRLAYERLAAMQ
jgi:hypothetical protein